MTSLMSPPRPDSFTDSLPPPPPPPGPPPPSRSTTNNQRGRRESPQVFFGGSPSGSTPGAADASPEEYRYDHEDENASIGSASGASAYFGGGVDDSLNVEDSLYSTSGETEITATTRGGIGLSVVSSPTSSTPSPLSPRSLNSNQVGEDAAGRPLSPRKAGAGFFKTRRRPSLSIDTGAIPSKVKHLGATNAVGSTPVPSSIPMEKPPVNNGSNNNPISPNSNTSNNMDDSTTITTLNTPTVNVTSPPNHNVVYEQDDDSTHDYEYYQGDSDSGANYRKNRGEDADGKKKKSLFKGMFRRSHLSSKKTDTVGNGKSSKMKKSGSSGNIGVMSAKSPASTAKSAKGYSTPSQNLKPGMSYKSTPHSAEIVVDRNKQPTHFTNMDEGTGLNLGQKHSSKKKSNDDGMYDGAESFETPSFGGGKSNQIGEDFDHSDEVSEMTNPTYYEGSVASYSKASPSHEFKITGGSPNRNGKYGMTNMYPLSHIEENNYDGFDMQRNSFGVPTSADPFKEPFYKASSGAAATNSESSQPKPILSPNSAASLPSMASSILRANDPFSMHLSTDIAGGNSAYLSDDDDEDEEEMEHIANSDKHDDNFSTASSPKKVMSPLDRSSPLAAVGEGSEDSSETAVSVKVPTSTNKKNDYMLKVAQKGRDKKQQRSSTTDALQGSSKAQNAVNVFAEKSAAKGRDRKQQRATKEAAPPSPRRTKPTKDVVPNAQQLAASARRNRKAHAAMTGRNRTESKKLSPSRDTTGTSDERSVPAKPKQSTSSPYYDSLLLNPKPKPKAKAFSTQKPQPAYYTADNKFSEINDPIQRAGVRLLSAASIPIQREIRRYLAIKEREDRSMCLIKIQCYFRRWKAEHYLNKWISAAVMVQSNFKGWLLRDNLEDEHYCATQIQRIARGYVVTMKVYDDMYSVIVVQSVVRRHQAAMAANKLRLVKMNHCATMIQAQWRGFVNYLDYKAYMEEEHAATTIQKYWRGYRENMKLLYTLVHVITIQALVRGHQERNWLEHQKKGARMIQNNIRCFLSRKRARAIRMRAMLKRAGLMGAVGQAASTVIQRWWRGFFREKLEKAAALVIERFFIMVKMEVDRELARIEREVKTKKKRRKPKSEREYIHGASRSADIDVEDSRRNENYGYHPRERGRDHGGYERGMDRTPQNPVDVIKIKESRPGRHQRSASIGKRHPSPNPRMGRSFESQTRSVDIDFAGHEMPGSHHSRGVYPNDAYAYEEETAVSGLTIPTVLHHRGPSPSPPKRHRHPRSVSPSPAQHQMHQRQYRGPQPRYGPPSNEAPIKDIYHGGDRRRVDDRNMHRHGPPSRGSYGHGHRQEYQESPQHPHYVENGHSQAPPIYESYSNSSRGERRHDQRGPGQRSASPHQGGRRQRSASPHRQHAPMSHQHQQHQQHHMGRSQASPRSRR
eukprot:scaffold45268_cov51-Attheya_sp.AAC.2